MPGCAQSAVIESAIRLAVAAGSYQQADQSLPSYSAQLAAELVSLSSAEMADELLRASQFLQWMFRSVSAARAFDQAQLAQALSNLSYAGAELRPAHSWGLDA